MYETEEEFDMHSHHSGRHGRGRDIREALHAFAEQMAAGRTGHMGRGGRRHGHDDDGESRHFGGFGGPRGGRPLGHGDLRLLLLALIGETPRHGYDLIRAVEDRFGGAYTPSPGAVYPTLTMLEEQDMIRAEAAEGVKKVFAITPEGEAFLKDNAAQIEGMFARIDLAAAAFARHSAPDEVREAWKTLRQAMNLRRTPWTQEDADRTCAILLKAARDIVGK